MLHWIDCGIVCLCSHGSSSCCLWLIVILFICVLMTHPHIAMNWLWHCLSVFSLFFFMLPWIDCDIVYLCSHGSFSCCIGLILTLFICVLYVSSSFNIRLNVTLFIWFSWFFLTLHWIDCDIVNLCFHGSSTCCIGLIVTLFICVLMVLLHVAFNWLWYCYSVFSWFFLMLPWFDCDIVFSVFSWFFLHDAFDLLWHCSSLFSWFFLVLH